MPAIPKIQTMLQSWSWRNPNGLATRRCGMSEYPDMRQRRSGGSFYSAFRWPGMKGIIEVSLKTSDPKIAQERLADLRSDLRRGIDPRGVFKNIEKACERYLATVTPTKAAKSQYMDRSRIKNHINPFFGGKRLGHVATDESCIAYKAFRESEGASRETIEKELWLFKGIVNCVP